MRVSRISLSHDSQTFKESLYIGHDEIIELFHRLNKFKELRSQKVILFILIFILLESIGIRNHLIGILDDMHRIIRN